MSRTSVIILLAAFSLLQACSNGDNPAAATEAGTAAPQATAQSTATPAQAQLTVTDVAPAAADAAASTYQSLQGEPLELSAYAGKKVFLNYWATWCAPCIREIPSIARAAGILEQENFVFLLASDESVETIGDFLADREFTGNFIKLNGYFGSHGIDAVPSSVLFDETGAIVKSWPGAFEWDSPEMLA
ncbi:MAG: TlpA disulfide reductase family protein, partial [Pseudomonadota bacterium]